uniref:Uncharacterized protein n=1 Tax=Listeria ivanovii TaxID=1638 RepID=A0A7T0MBN3_LISIV|nr:hypothetical protein [Listeria ivanovii]QPL19501.1 hypothetical protein pLIS600331c [Listeria ivanovii]UCK61632.1 hypothetical protein pLIS46_00311c [Listeria ivanovii]
MTNLGRTDYQEEIKLLKSLLDSCYDPNDRAIIKQMERSTLATKAMDSDVRKMKKENTQGIKKAFKKPLVPNYITHSIGESKKKVRASVLMGLSEHEFCRMDKVYIRTFDSKYGAAEYVVDRQKENCLKHQSAYAVERNGTRRVLLREIYPYVRNIRTQTNDMIAKRKHIHRTLAIQAPFKESYQSFLT